MGAALNRGNSAQDYETPDDFMNAVRRKYGAPEWDLAARDATVAKARAWITPEDDSLSISWANLRYPGDSGYVRPLLWLNPPFDPVAPWVKKCVVEAHGGARILLLTRASLGANWWWQYVSDDEEAAIVFPGITVHMLTPRLKFAGCKDVYPADLMLTTFNVEDREPIDPWLKRWRWK